MSDYPDQVKVVQYDREVDGPITGGIYTIDDNIRLTYESYLQTEYPEDNISVDWLYIHSSSNLAIVGMTQDGATGAFIAAWTGSGMGSRHHIKIPHQDSPLGTYIQDPEGAFVPGTEPGYAVVSEYAEVSKTFGYLKNKNLIAKIYTEDNITQVGDNIPVEEVLVSGNSTGIYRFYIPIFDLLPEESGVDEQQYFIVVEDTDTDELVLFDGVMVDEEGVHTVDGLIKRETDKVPELSRFNASEDKVTVETNEDKEGYSLATAPPTAEAIRSELSSDFDQLNTKLNAIGYIHQVQIEGNLSPDVTGTYTRTDPKGLFKICYVNEAETWYYGQRDTGEWIITFDASGGKPTWDAYWEGTQQLLTPGNEHATGTAFVVNIVLGAELSNKVLSNVASAITDSLPGVELDSSTLAEMANIISSTILGSPEFTRLVPGTGPVPFEYTVYRPDGETVIPEVFVYVYNSPTLTYNNLVATGITNNHGKVTLFLTPGTYYFVRVKAGYRFENPDIEIVEAL